MYTKANLPREAFYATLRNTETEIQNSPDYVHDIVEELFSKWDFSQQTLTLIRDDLSRSSISEQASFIVRFYHELRVPDSGRIFKSSSTLGVSYFVAGLIGLIPYMAVNRTQVKKALHISIAVEAVALAVFGYCKTGFNIGWVKKENVKKALWGAVIMVIVGTLAAGIAVGLITGVNKSEHIAG